ncbi:MAG: threonylcarbamoyl-AMP synthase [Deltaproteobacteria bacterium]|nr:threonylcarbamoyl-AMP synthase [Deltaproteobacteria bacterium]
MAPCFVRIDPCAPSPRSIKSAVDVMRAGGVVAYPTETFYGLGVDALSGGAIRKIYSIKKRDPSQPLLILISHYDLLSEYVAMVPEIARKLTERFWPGPLTIIFSASPRIPSLLCAGTGKIAVRISSHPIARALAAAMDVPITSTSANLTGLPSPTMPEEVFNQLHSKIDMIIDGGKTMGGMPSTIVDVTMSPLQLVREGAISFNEILKVG